MAHVVVPARPNPSASAASGVTVSNGAGQNGFECLRRQA